MSDTKNALRSSPVQPEVRDCVLNFAKEMERKLKLNDYKGGWDDISIREFMERIEEEIEEVWHLIPLKNGDGNKIVYPDQIPDGLQKEIIDELADVANFCMMFVDLLRKAK